MNLKSQIKTMYFFSIFCGKLDMVKKFILPLILVILCFTIT